MKNKIQFVLNGTFTEVDFEKEQLSPTTTVLNYLRGSAKLTGTKEGCAEGDCGACSVVMVKSNGTELNYVAVDSCLMFLPMMHGKELITVEGVGCSTDLHPVQQAMVDSDGSQCGYCTPGFISSMFALHQNTENPSRAEIDDALTGNLCRCTGYRPIVEAAEKACNTPAVKERDDFDTQITLNSIQKTTTIEIENESQAYYKPFTLDTLLDLKKAYSKSDALLVNGATDIGLMVTKQNKLLPLLIDISDVAELKAIEEDETEVRYGAGLDLETMRRHCEKLFPAMYDMLTVFGSRQIRILGTIGGNVANASPIGDTPPVLMSYGAKVEVASKEGTRIMDLEDFITGYRTTDLKEDEIITAIIIPKSDGSRKYKSYKISKRKDLDISTVSAGFSVQLTDGGNVDSIDLFYGGMAAETKRAAQAETFLTGKTWDRSNVEEAMQLVDSEFTPISDARAQKEGRTVMARNLLLKFWSETS